MLKTQIIATDLSNLTDARYFAAWGVDFVGFNCNPGEDTYVEPAVLKEIKEWIEGPLFLGMFNGLQPAAEIEEQVEKMELDGVLLGHFTPAETLNHIDAEHLLKELKADAESTTNPDPKTIMCTTKEGYKEYLATGCFLDISDLDIDVVKDILQNSSCGLVLRGGNEEKVGFKSFDFLDEVFEELIED